MKEEISAITQRLDRMEGQLLAHHVLLIAMASDLKGRDWTFLLEADDQIDPYSDALRHSPVSDATLHAFRSEVALLRRRLSEMDHGGLPF